MNIKKTGLTLLVLVAGLFGGLAMAQQERIDPTARPQPMDAAELERLSAQPSLEDAILKIAAEKLRQEKRPTTTVEMPVTVRVTKVTAPTCYYITCVRVGTKWAACKSRLCNEVYPD